MALNVRFALALCLLLVFCSACQTPADSLPTSTLQPVVTPHATEETLATGIPVTIVPTDDGQPSALSSNRAYSLAASPAQVLTPDSEIEIPASYPDLPADYKFVVVTATVTNVSGTEPIAIERDHLALIDSDGNEYPPVEVEGVSPLIYDLELEPEASVRGFALFAVPEAFTPEHIQWCPAGDCEQITQSPIVIPATSP